MYRIHFDPKIGRFVIQIYVLWIYWKTVKCISSKEQDSSSHSFGKYTEALAYVSEIGLDKLYESKSADKYREHMKQAQLPLGDSFVRQ